MYQISPWQKIWTVYKIRQISLTTEVTGFYWVLPCVINTFIAGAEKSDWIRHFFNLVNTHLFPPQLRFFSFSIKNHKSLIHLLQNTKLAEKSSFLKRVEHAVVLTKNTLFNSQGQLRDHYLGKVKLVSNVKIDRYQEMKALLRNVRETKNAARDAAKEAKQRRQDS